MLRQGVISAFVHGIAEYLEAIVLIAAPFVFDFDSGAARAVAIVAGVVVIVVTATTEWRVALSPTLPIGVHVALDVVLAVVLIGAPFVFGFSGEGTATAFFIVLGVAHLLLTIATRFLPPRTTASA